MCLADSMASAVTNLNPLNYDILIESRSELSKQLGKIFKKIKKCSCQN